MLSEYQSRISDNKKYVLIAGGLFIVLLVGIIGQSLTLGSQGDYGGDSLEYSQDLTSNAGAPGLENDASYDRRSGGDAGNTDRKRITTIRVDFEVADALEAQSDAKKLTEDYGGWIESESFRRSDAGRADLDVRIPKENVSDFLNQAESNWELDSKNENTKDVTDRYTEMSLELENKRQELQRLEELIDDTDDVENLIQIQERMSDLRSRIQYLENNLEEIDERVEYVEIDMTFQEDEPITAEFELREAVKDSLQGIFSSLRLMIVGAGYLLPFALLATIIYYGRKAFRTGE